MSIAFRCIAVVIVLSAVWAAPAPVRAADFCKWVDADGVTHYATRCPREIDGRMLDVDAPPDWREHEEDEPGTEEAKEASEATPNRAPRSAEALEAAAQAAAQKRADEACREALRQLDELSTALPVYRDNGGVVHADETLHHWWYRGPRTYLEGPDRRDVFAETEADASRLCGQRIDVPRPPIPFFTRAPLPRDVVAWLQDPANAPVTPAQLCPYATRLARNLRRDRPDNPTDDMRRLDAALLSACSSP